MVATITQDLETVLHANPTYYGAVPHIRVVHLVYVQEGDRSFLARIEKLEMQPDHWSMDPGTGQYRFYQGYLVTRVVTL